MILPIRTYGCPILREQTEEIGSDSPELQELIDNMLETMRGAEGIGLAAPQIGRRERLFVVDLSPLAEELQADGEEVGPQPMVVINPVILDEVGDEVGYEEGCLSIPDIREEVYRPPGIRVSFLDRMFQEQTVDASGMLARVMQHEYDHLEGVLFVDHISSFRRNLLRRRLREMARGVVEADYPTVLEV